MGYERAVSAPSDLLHIARTPRKTNHHANRAGDSQQCEHHKAKRDGHGEFQEKYHNTICSSEVRRATLLRACHLGAKEIVQRHQAQHFALLVILQHDHLHG